MESSVELEKSKVRSNRPKLDFHPNSEIYGTACAVVNQQLAVASLKNIFRIQNQSRPWSSVSIVVFLSIFVSFCTMEYNTIQWRRKVYKICVRKCMCWIRWNNVLETKSYCKHFKILVNVSTLNVLVLACV